MHDVIVVGGGISGVMAAVASARCGAGTLLVEQYGFLGGMLTASGVGPMMTFHAGEKQVVKGLTGELIERLVSKGKSPGHIPDMTGYTYTVTPFDLEAMKVELEEMLCESGAEVLYHTKLAKVQTSEDSINSITVCNKDGLVELSAKVYVDATGDADLSAWAGVPCHKGRETDGLCQPMTMKVRMNNVDVGKVKEYIRANPDEFPRFAGDNSKIDSSPRLSIPGYLYTLKDAKMKREITFNREEVLFFETNNPGEIIINMTRVEGYDSTNPRDLTKAEMEGRKQAAEVVDFFKKRIEGFENAQLLFTGPFIGIRSSRQIAGLHTITEEELLSCRKYTDVIAHSGYPMDVHPPKGEYSIDYVKEHINQNRQSWGAVRSIPYGSLVNERAGNLITVGRCISATFQAQGAIRTTPIAGAIGHAGGCAAALSVMGNCRARDIDVGELQKLIIGQGGYLEI